MPLIGKYYKCWSAATRPLQTVTRNRYIQILGVEDRHANLDKLYKGNKTVYIYKDLKSGTLSHFEEGSDFAKGLQEATETEVVLYANRP